MSKNAKSGDKAEVESPVWSKLITALRGGINELGEWVIDTQALRILDQEIRDLTEANKLALSKRVEVEAKSAEAREGLEQSKSALSELEHYVLKAHKRGEADLSLQLATQAGKLEDAMQEDQKTFESLQAQIIELNEIIDKTAHDIARLRQQADVVRAAETVQKAQASVAARKQQDNTSLNTALESLARFRQQKSIELVEKKKNIRHSFGLILDEDLRQKLEKAGILENDNSPSALLDKILAKHKGGKRSFD